MIYQEYYQKANFEKVWAILHEVYGEKEDSKPLYNKVFDAIRAKGIDQSLANETIKIKLRLFGDKKAQVEGAPDPQEWLVDRKVEIVGFHIHYMTDCFVNTVTAHLLYWSTLYGIKTRAMERAEFQKWLTDITAGPNYTPIVDTASNMERERIGDINAESCDRKKLHYWKQTILCDGPYNWSDNLVILQKKIEYNIGYFRLTQRFEGWEHTVGQMVKACKLISIVLGHDRQETQPYVNARNYTRFNMEPPSPKSEYPTFSEYWKEDLRKAKAYKLLWQLLSKDMKEWWD